MTQTTLGTEQAKAIVFDWIRDDLRPVHQMTLTPKEWNALISKIAEALDA